MELQKQLALELKARANAESELFNLLSMEWQAKYENAMSEISMLTENMAEKEQYNEIELARLNRARDFLTSQIYSIEDKLFDAEETLGEHENKSLTDNEKWQVENQLLNEQLKIAESQKNDLKKRVEKLELKINHQNKITEPVNNEKSSISSDHVTTDTPVAQKKLSGDKNKSDIYRHVRLQSLHSAMLNQDSGTRSKILISVIPSIPNGISGGELQGLLVDMNSPDVINVIKSVNKYILRPLDSQTVHTITANMDQNDAETIALLLLNEQ